MRHGALLLLLASVAGCAPTVLAPVRPERIDDFTGFARTEDASLGATTRAWTAEPRDLSERATPMFVRLLNRTSRSLRVSRDTFAIEGPGKRFAALAPDQISGSTEVMRELELPPETLRPGEEASGFLYFERVAGTWGILALRATLVDAIEQQLVGTIDVRFLQATIRGCTLRDVEETAPWPRGSLFETCLPPTYAR